MIFSLILLPAAFFFFLLMTAQLKKIKNASAFYLQSFFSITFTQKNIRFYKTAGENYFINDIFGYASAQ